MTFPPKVWDGALRRLRLELPPFTCEAWLESLVAATSPDGASTTSSTSTVPTSTGRDTGGLLLLCPTAFHRDRVRDLYLSRIRACVEAEAGRPVDVQLDVSEASDDTEEAQAAVREASPSERASQEPAGAAEPAAAEQTLAAPRAETVKVRRLPEGAAATPRAASARSAAGANRPCAFAPVQHTFESFVVGDCNSLAREASLAVVRESGPGLSQLYICSEPGLGKTHLSRAVFSEARANGRRPVYASAEAFTNEFLASLRSHQMERFKRKFRSDCDVLVVEDVHFLEGKESTQLEFFHSVQHVLDAGGRVVLTGNRLPGSLTALEPRLRSQVAGGFVCELGPPDAQVRRNILRSKAAAGGVRLPEDCLEMLVDAVRGNVRDLEGVLIQLVTAASLLKRAIDPEMTREALEKKGALRSQPSAARLGTADVIAVVAAFFKTTLDVMSSKSRRREVLLPRQLAMYLCDKYTDASLVEIGRGLGRDHPSVRNAITKVERQLLESAPLRYQVEALIGRLDELVRSRGPGTG